MRRWIASLIRGRPFIRENREWWARIAETILAAALLLMGVIGLALSLTLAVLYSTPDRLYISVGQFSLQLVVATVLIGIGAYRIVWLLWKVGVSVERRGAIVSRANEIEILKETNRRREDLPTVPVDRFLPKPGENLNFELIPSPRNVWGLITSAVFTIGFVVLDTILISTAIASWRRGETDWFEAGLALPITFAACWSIYQFIRQLLKLTGIGQTFLEIGDYPLFPGQSYRAFISQYGRVRLRRLDVCLICQEEATFNQGTDIMTEQATVLDQRLLRRRGIRVTPGNPFEAEFGFSIPAESMHSFKSPNNRIQWKIVVSAQAKNWPLLKRVFAISVHPTNQLSTRNPTQS